MKAVKKVCFDIFEGGGASRLTNSCTGRADYERMASGAGWVEVYGWLNIDWSNDVDRDLIAAGIVSAFFREGERFKVKRYKPRYTDGDGTSAPFEQVNIRNDGFLDIVFTGGRIITVNAKKLDHLHMIREIDDNGRPEKVLEFGSSVERYWVHHRRILF